jgi:hypothetical protein
VGEQLFLGAVHPSAGTNARSRCLALNPLRANSFLVALPCVSHTKERHRATRNWASRSHCTRLLGGALQMLRQRLLRCSLNSGFLVSVRIGLSCHPGFPQPDTGALRTIVSCTFGITVLSCASALQGSQDLRRASCTRGKRLRSRLVAEACDGCHPLIGGWGPAPDGFICLEAVADHACPFQLLRILC